jgi:hypothetical protein
MLFPAHFPILMGTVFINEINGLQQHFAPFPNSPAFLKTRGQREYKNGIKRHTAQSSNAPKPCSSTRSDGGDGATQPDHFGELVEYLAGAGTLQRSRSAGRGLLPGAHPLAHRATLKTGAAPKICENLCKNLKFISCRIPCKSMICRRFSSEPLKFIAIESTDQMHTAPDPFCIVGTRYVQEQLRSVPSRPQ